MEKKRFGRFAATTTGDFFNTEASSSVNSTEWLVVGSWLQPATVC